MKVKTRYSMIVIALFSLATALVSGASAYAQGCTYTVQPGDSLYSVADQFGLQPWELQEMNDDLYPQIWTTIQSGWTLQVPCATGSTPGQTGDTIPVPAPGISTITATPRSNVNARLGPDTSYRIAGTAFSGVAYPVVARDARSEWVLVDDGKLRGWVAAWLVRLSGSISSLPVSNEVIGGGSASPPAPPSTGGGGGSVPPSSANRGFEIGGQTHSFANPGVMRQAGMTWVKFQHKWAPDQSPASLADRINQAHAAGFKVLISIPGAEYPSSINYSAYVEFLRGLAAYGPDGIEIWNEMNLDREWPAGQISPASYVNNMLAPAYLAIKSVNPNIIVISGALAPTGVNNGVTVMSDDNFVAGMRDAGAARYMDCVGVHHNAGATAPNQAFGHPADNGLHHYSWYFQPTFKLYADAFPRTQVCFTEIGYLTPHLLGPLPGGFWWGGDTDIHEHSAWLAQAARMARDSKRVKLFVVFNVDFDVFGDDPQAGYAILRRDGTCPACAGLAAAAGQ